MHVMVVESQRAVERAVDSAEHKTRANDETDGPGETCAPARLPE
jgi:hypothetical protein